MDIVCQKGFCWKQTLIIATRMQSVIRSQPWKKVWYNPLFFKVSNSVIPQIDGCFILNIPEIVSVYWKQCSLKTKPKSHNSKSGKHGNGVIDFVARVHTKGKWKFLVFRFFIEFFFYCNAHYFNVQYGTLRGRIGSITRTKTTLH